MDRFFAILVFPLVVLTLSGTTTGAPPKPSCLFVFGDSYGDTGNQKHSSRSWKYPYGITWPGYPTGRFGNGHIQTDFLAEKLGLRSPTPYVDVTNRNNAIGINFAIGGSGVTYALGVLPLNTQVDQFELVLRTEAYSPSFLADSVTLVSIEGNDYGGNYESQEYLVVAREVIEGLTVALKRMYELGLRNILVANLPPINCLPATTVASNYTACRSSSTDLILFHNDLLLETVEKLNALPNANFIVLDEMKAFAYILNNTERHGIKNDLVPCCRPFTAGDNCGDVDEQNNPRYTLCKDPTSFVFWDMLHPVESTWKRVVDLFYNETGFVIGASNLESWLCRNALRSPAPARGFGVSQEGAYGELEAAHQALISEPDFAESLGLLDAVNWEEYLHGIPHQVVTVFLPNNRAIYSTPSSNIDQIYGHDEVVPLAKSHVVKGYYDSHVLLGGSIRSLTTLTGTTLLVTPVSNLILVGPANGTVVRLDLYKVQSQVVIHGINKILIAPDLTIE